MFIAPLIYPQTRRPKSSRGCSRRTSGLSGGAYVPGMVAHYRDSSKVRIYPMRATPNACRVWAPCQTRGDAGSGAMRTSFSDLSPTVLLQKRIVALPPGRRRITDMLLVIKPHGADLAIRRKCGGEGEERSWLAPFFLYC